MTADHKARGGVSEADVEKLTTALDWHKRQLRVTQEALAVARSTQAAAEARAVKAVERVKALEEALRPFAKAGELFRPRDPDDYDQCVYKPAAGPAYQIYGDHLRAASALLSDHPAPEPGVEAGKVRKAEHPWLLRGQGDEGPESISYLGPEGWTDDINEATGWSTRMSADVMQGECRLEGIIVEVVWAEDERRRRALQIPAIGGRDAE